MVGAPQEPHNGRHDPLPHRKELTVTTPTPLPPGLRAAAWGEGITLALLLILAVPAKHWLGDARGVALLGPVHGLAFGVYVWQLAQCATFQRWGRPRILAALFAALVPFGALVHLSRGRPDPEADHG